MNPDDYAVSFTTALDVWAALRPRSLQRDIGVSDIGYCYSKARWKLDGITPTDDPGGRQALMGIAAHEVIGAARRDYASHLLIEPELEVTLPSGLVVPGHADEIDPTEPSVTDYKTVSGADEMVALRRTGSTEQQRWQRQLYYYGAHQAGLVPAEGIVRNVWIDRAGQSCDPFVEQEPFSMRYVHEADEWIESVLYAREHAEELPRDKHYDHCQQFCEFFSHCRQGTDQPDLVVTDPELVQAARYALDGRRQKKEGEALESAGKRVLAPLQPDPGGDVQAFVAGDVRLRWSWVNKQTGGHYVLHLDDVES